MSGEYPKPRDWVEGNIGLGSCRPGYSGWPAISSASAASSNGPVEPLMLRVGHRHIRQDLGMAWRPAGNHAADADLSLKRFSRTRFILQIEIELAEQS